MTWRQNMHGQTRATSVLQTRSDRDMPPGCVVLPGRKPWPAIVRNDAGTRPATPCGHHDLWSGRPSMYVYRVSKDDDPGPPVVQSLQLIADTRGDLLVDTLMSPASSGEITLSELRDPSPPLSSYPPLHLPPVLPFTAN